MPKDTASFHGPIIRGDLHVVQELVEQGVSVDEPMGVHKKMPLHFAIERGQTAIALFLISKVADINCNSDQHARTPLHLAAEKGNVDVLLALLAAGADVQRGDKNGWAPLDTAATNGGAQAGLMVAELIKHGADVHRPSPNWGPPLIKACYRGHISAIQALLEHGADPNVMALWGTPLIKAVDHGRADAIPILRAAGADPNLRFVWPESSNASKDYINKTPLELAIHVKRPNLVALLEAPLGASAPAAVPMTAADVPALWSRIEKALANAAPGTAKSLRQGMTQTDHDEAARICGVTFPEDFLASCQLHDGQVRNADRSFVPERWCDVPYDLLPLKEIVRAWSIWKGLLDKGEFRGQPSTPEDGVRSDWWHPGWLPFAGNGGGDFLCVDLAPTDKGRVGQVIEMRHDSKDRRRLTASFADFLREIADRWDALAAR